MITLYLYNLEVDAGDFRYFFSFFRHVSFDLLAGLDFHLCFFCLCCTLVRLVLLDYCCPSNERLVIEFFFCLNPTLHLITIFNGYLLPALLDTLVAWSLCH